MSDALAIADVDQQNAFRVNEHEPQYRGRRNRAFGCGVSINLTHAHVEREKPPAPAPIPAPIAPPAVETPQPAATAPDMIDDRFEVYRVVTDYDALCEAFSERVEDIQATRLGIDAAGRFAGGHASTLLCRPQIKGYGPTSLTRMLEACGLVIVLAIDDEKFAKVKDRLILRERQLRPAVYKPTAPQ
jgi:hypothetical protein